MSKNNLLSSVFVVFVVSGLGVVGGEILYPETQADPQQLHFAHIANSRRTMPSLKNRMNQRSIERTVSRLKTSDRDLGN